MEREIQYKSIFDFLRVYPDEQACINHLTQQRWKGHIVSPFDSASKVYVCKGNKYKCKNTGKYFNCKTGTIFESTNIPLMKWFLCLYVFSSHKKGITSHQLAKDISVTQKSAWFMLHRLRYAFAMPKEQLEGVIEADCTYVGGKTSNKHKSKRDIDNAKGTGTVNKKPVFGMVERNGLLVAGVIEKEDKANIHPILKAGIAPGSTLISDGHSAYRGVAGLNHLYVEHEKGEYARNHISTGNIDGFWSQFKRGIKGLYHQVSPKHTDRYVQEFVLRKNTIQLNTCERFDFILSNMVKRLTYKQLING